MGFISIFLTRVRRADTPFYAFLKRFSKAVRRFEFKVPHAILPLYKALALGTHVVRSFYSYVIVILYRRPIFRAFCQTAGSGLELEYQPIVAGPLKVHVGDDVRLSGLIQMIGTTIFGSPELIIGNRVFIGHGCSFHVAKRIVIGDDVLIAGDCIISDYPAHPMDADKRAAGQPCEPERVRPISIGAKAWLGRRAIILPGVTIGEGAIIGTGSVVTKNVPPYQLCVGNPGRIVERSQPVNGVEAFQRPS